MSSLYPVLSRATRAHFCTSLENAGRGRRIYVVLLETKTMKNLATAVLALLMAASIGFAAPQSASTQSSTTTTKTTTTHTRSSKESSGAKLDINAASQQELEALPGIGPATSAKIIQGRPYRAKSDLLKHKIVSRSEYDKIKDEIVAHQKK